MRKRYKTLHTNHKDSSREDFFGPKEIAKKVKRPKKVLKLKYFILTIVAIILVVVGYLGISSIKAANNILGSNISVSSLLKQSSLKQADGVTNILVLGKGGDNHAGGQLTDTIMLVRIKEADKKVAFISIPRDLMVTVPSRGQVKINEAYTQGFNSEKDKNKKNESGAQVASQVIEKTMGVPIHYYMVVDFIGFNDLVDALGGITVNVEKNLDDPYYPKDSIVNGKLVESEAYSPVHIKAGIQNMDGELALKYSRSRETTSDFDRAKRQQQVVFAIKEKALSLGILSNPIKLNDVFQSLGNHIKTNFNANELSDMMNLVKDLSKSEVINKVIDNSANGLLVSSDEGFYHLEPKAGNFTQVQAFVKNVFDNTEDISLIEVEVLNGTKTVGLAGKFADTLKAKGFSVTKIENSPELYEKTTVFDGTNSSSANKQIKALLVNAETKTLEEKGKIRVILGKDYGN
jgi:LCP family protein required for cell wall assembly